MSEHRVLNVIPPNEHWKRVFAIAALVDLILMAVFLGSDLKAFWVAHIWWQDLLVAMATIALPVLAFFELAHSQEANRLRSEANILREKANHLDGEANNFRNQANDLRREKIGLERQLDEERNEHMAQIAQNTRPPVTTAERNTSILRRYLGTKMIVTEAHKGLQDSSWGDPAELVDIR